MGSSMHAIAAAGVPMAGLPDRRTLAGPRDRLSVAVMPEGASRGIESCIGLYPGRTSQTMPFSFPDNFRWNPIAWRCSQAYDPKQWSLRHALGLPLMFRARTPFYEMVR